MAKTVPLPASQASKDGTNSRLNDQRGIKSAPIADGTLNHLKHSPDSSVDNAAERDELLMMEQNSYNDLGADQDDNLSVRS